MLVTSQEIDELCEADNIAQARLQMDGVLGQLRRSAQVTAMLRSGNFRSQRVFVTVTSFDRPVGERGRWQKGRHV